MSGAEGVVDFCQACLASRLRFWDVSATQEYEVFHQLIGMEPPVPRHSVWVCSECVHRLRTFHKFREKVRNANRLLFDTSDASGSRRHELFELLRSTDDGYTLSQSNTLVIDVSYSVNDERQTSTVFSLAHNNTDKNYSEDMITVSALKNTSDDHFLDSDTVPGGKSPMQLCQVKLEDIELTFGADYVHRNDSKKRKRRAKELGEKKRALILDVSDDVESNFDDSHHYEEDDDDDDDDSSIETTKIKRGKKTKGSRRKSKRNARESKLDDCDELFSFCSDNQIDNDDTSKSSKTEGTKSEFSSRMVLETEQYKVIKLTRDELLAEMSMNMKSQRYVNSPYKCTLCVKGFNYEDVLQNHMLKHQPKNGDFECDLCHQFLPSAVSMRGHKKSHNTKYQCKKCGIVKASRQHLLEHYMLDHEGAPRTYICNVCGKTMTKRTMFQKHMRIHYPSNKIACDKCGKLFKNIETLRAHMLRHGDIKRYSCDECHKAFRYASTLYTHKVTHITTKEYYCVECDLHFKTQSNLRLHLRKSLKHVDPDLLIYDCKQCDKRYEDEKGLRHHVEWVHLRQKNYKCVKCDMLFGSQDGLRSHKKKIHDGIRPPRRHVCEVCNKGFMARAVLVKHQRTHTGERPYECAECGKKFAQNSTMTTHIKLVHLKIQRQVNRKKSASAGHSSKKIEPEPMPPAMYHVPMAPEQAETAYYYTTGPVIDPTRSACVSLLTAPLQFHEPPRGADGF